LSSGVRGGGAEGHPQKFSFVENLGKISENSGKIPEHLDKISENLGKILKIWEKWHSTSLDFKK